MDQKKILIVEDEPDIREALRDKLEREGFLVVVAEDGLQGLDLAEKESPDLILLDIVLPKLDGLTMTERMRKTDWGKNMKIILLTNLSDVNTVAAAQSRNVFDYLVKADWEINDVIQKVKVQLGVTDSA